MCKADPVSRSVSFRKILLVKQYKGNFPYDSMKDVNLPYRDLPATRAGRFFIPREIITRHTGQDTVVKHRTRAQRIAYEYSEAIHIWYLPSTDLVRSTDDETTRTVKKLCFVIKGSHELNRRDFGGAGFCVIWNTT